MSGTAASYDGMLQMVHPDRVVSEADLHTLPLIEPVYPLTEGLSLNVVRKAAEAALGEDAGAAGMAGRRRGCSKQNWPGFDERTVGTASSGRPERDRARNAGMVAARL